MRGYYLCIPILLWVVGPIWLLAGSILTTVAPYNHDFKNHSGNSSVTPRF